MPPNCIITSNVTVSARLILRLIKQIMQEEKWKAAESTLSVKNRETLKKEILNGKLHFLCSVKANLALVVFSRYGKGLRKKTIRWLISECFFIIVVPVLHWNGTYVIHYALLYKSVGVSFLRKSKSSKYLEHLEILLWYYFGKRW